MRIDSPRITGSALISSSLANEHSFMGANVGIGTTNPEGNLHIHAANAGSVTAPSEGDNLIIEDSTTPGMSFLFPANSKGSIYFGTPTDNDQMSIIGDTNNNRFDFAARNASDIIRFRPAGGVLNLTLKGAAGSEMAQFEGDVSGSATSTGSFGRLQVTTLAGNSPLNIEGTPVFKGNISGSATSTGSFGSVAAGGTGLNTFAGSVSIGNTGIHEKLRVEGEIKAHADVGDVRISIDSATNSDAQLKFLNGGGNSHVIFSDGSATNDPLIFYDYASSTQMMTLNNGKVGIGTTSPARALHVVGDALITGILTAQEFHTEFVSASVVFESGSTKFGDTQDDIHNFTGSFRQSGSLGNHYFQTGNVGIGTSSPGVALEQVVYQHHLVLLVERVHQQVDYNLEHIMVILVEYGMAELLPQLIIML